MADPGAFPPGRGWGLVLSGGGARGAYEAGVAAGLADLGFEPIAYAGASIGALNAAILASHPGDFRAGASALWGFWETFDRDRVFRRGPIPLVPDVAFLESMLQTHVAFDGPMAPLWVSIYESAGSLLDLLRFGAARGGLWESPPATYRLLSDLAPADRLPALLASAALPIILPAQEIDGQLYRDGGLGAGRSAQGNTPLAPLEAAGCEAAVVVQLTDGCLWSRQRHPGTAVLQIRPGEQLHPDGPFWSLLDFDQFQPDRLRLWMAQGRRDAEATVGPALRRMDRASERNGRRERLRGAIVPLDELFERKYALARAVTPGDRLRLAAAASRNKARAKRPKR